MNIKRLQYTLYGVIGVLVLGALAFKIFQPVQVLPRIRLAPGFALTDQTGERVTNEDLRGQFTLYTFMYTRCDTRDCETINQTMREVQAGIAEQELDGITVELMTISFDPAHDTPPTMAAYAESVGAEPGVWNFATTDDPTTLKNIIGGGFEVYYAPSDDGEKPFSFDPVFVLVDGWGIIRGEYHYQTLATDSERILRHIGVLAEEVHNSQGARKAAYEAAHLFLCYAP